jgi:hypothetical protein
MVGCGLSAVNGPVGRLRRGKGAQCHHANENGFRS